MSETIRAPKTTGHLELVRRLTLGLCLNRHSRTTRVSPRSNPVGA
jgi:hypothetical protein